jgi:hypothetical protein
MHGPWRWLVVAALCIGTAGAQAAPPAAEIEAARRRADAAAGELVATLMARLTAALAEGGPEAAVRVCSEVAQDVTRAAGAGDGLVLRRTSLRTRNPANAPDPFERAWLDRAERAIAAGQPALPLYEVVAGPAGGRELRHLRPIVFPGGICASCHGPEDAMSVEVRTLLRERYPADRATGYAPGDLRGAISVRVPLP